MKISTLVAFICSSQHQILLRFCRVNKVVRPDNLTRWHLSFYFTAIVKPYESVCVTITQMCAPSTSILPQWVLSSGKLALYDAFPLHYCVLDKFHSHVILAFKVDESRHSKCKTRSCRMCFLCSLQCQCNEYEWMKTMQFAKWKKRIYYLDTCFVCWFFKVSFSQSNPCWQLWLPFWNALHVVVGIRLIIRV